MFRKAVSAIMMVVLVLGTVALVFKIKPVRASGTITIMADGSINPPTAPIERNGDEYTLTGTMVVDDNLDGLIIERNSTVLDGAGYCLQAPDTPSTYTRGIVLSERSNVTVKNIKFGNFGSSICLNSSSNITIEGSSAVGYWDSGIVQGVGITLEASSNNSITNCRITGIDGSLTLDASDANFISNNSLAAYFGVVSISGSFNAFSYNQLWGGVLSGASALKISGFSNSVIGNVVDGGGCAYALDFGGSYSSLIGNVVEGGGWTYTANLGGSYSSLIGNSILGTSLFSSVNSTLIGNSIESYEFYSSFVGNRLYHNSFLSAFSVDLTDANYWDNGYPFGGNYWSDYNGTDIFKGPYQNLTGSDGIGDTHYVIDSNNLDNYPLMNPWSPHDTAVTNVLPYKTVVGLGYIVSINVTVMNLGDFPENFNLTIDVISPLSGVHSIEGIETESVSGLLPNETRFVTLNWSTTGYSYGNYTVEASASTVPGETNKANNNCTGGNVFVTISGDINGDFRVSLQDLVLLANAYGSTPSSTKWNPNADINSDGAVNLTDLVLLAIHYGQHYP